MVFSDIDFDHDAAAYEGNTPYQISGKSKTEVLQAAYMCCLYQNWEGSDVSRRRIRRHRFTNLVSVCCHFVFHEYIAKQMKDSA